MSVDIQLIGLGIYKSAARLAGCVPPVTLQWLHCRG